MGLGRPSSSIGCSWLPLERASGNPARQRPRRGVSTALRPPGGVASGAFDHRRHAGFRGAPIGSCGGTYGALGRRPTELRPRRVRQNLWQRARILLLVR